MRFSRPLAALTLTKVVGSGCMTTSPSMETATGLLKVNGETTSHDGYYDSNLDYHGPGSFYTFKSFTVGDTEVDELTFFHVAGDAEKEAEVLAWRKANNTAALAGWSITGLGIGAAVAGAGLMAANSDDVETFVTTPLGQASFGLMAAGGIVVGMAFYAWTIFGPDKPLNGYDLVFDPATDAEDAAERANVRLRGETPPTPEAEAAPETSPPA